MFVSARLGECGDHMITVTSSLTATSTLGAAVTTGTKWSGVRTFEMAEGIHYFGPKEGALAVSWDC